MMRVSVVVPALNEAALLPACLSSLLDQDYPGEIEVLVVDNASTDGTGDVARRHGVRVVSEPTRGYCEALRAGFAAASGDVIACTDADTVTPRDWISRLVGAYDKAGEIVAVGGDIDFVEPNWKSRFLTQLVIPWVNRIDRGNPKGPHLWGANLSVRRTAFLAAGGWNPRFSLQADSELSERLRKVGKVVVLPGLKVRTSSRRWNRALLHNTSLYAVNFVWFHLFGGPLYREFPAVRDGAAVESVGFRGWRRAGWWTFATLAMLGGLAYAAFAPRSSAFGRTVWSGDARDSVVALTFDDGPNEPYTSQILEILRREHVRATFFMIGSNVRRDPAAARRVAEAGHVIGNHSDTHPPRFALESVARLRDEVDMAEESIHAATGVYPHFFRPPQGLRSPWLMSVLEQDSLVAVTWDDAPRDWDPLPADELVKRTLAQAHPGAIVLLHDGMNLTPHADQTQTVLALPRIIRGLRARGYRLVTLPELLGDRPALARWSPPARHHALAAARTDGLGS